MAISLVWKGGNFHGYFIGFSLWLNQEFYGNEQFHGA
jgi:hypothetical protein